jgi:ribonuclease Z
MTAGLELTLLGTSSPLHVPHRFGPSQIVRGGDATVLIDCGWGATLRLYQALLGPPGLPRVGAVLFTHLHSDHTTDFADFVVMRWLGGVSAPLPVYGPEGTARMVAGFRQAMSADTRFRLAHHGEKLSPIGTACDVTEIEAGEEPVEVARVGEIVVKAFAVDHRPVMPAFGFRLERGRSSIVLSGDTVPCPGLINGARDADILVCDSMNVPMMEAFEESLRGAGNSLAASLLVDAHTYHASTRDAAEVAATAGVKHLVLSHVLPAIPEDGPQVEAFAAGLADVFPGPITVGRDLQRFTLPAA